MTVTVGSVGALPKVMRFMCSIAVYNQVTNAPLFRTHTLSFPHSLSSCSICQFVTSQSSISVYLSSDVSGSIFSAFFCAMHYFLSHSGCITNFTFAGLNSSTWVKANRLLGEIRNKSLMQVSSTTFVQGKFFEADPAGATLSNKKRRRI